MDLNEKDIVFVVDDDPISLKLTRDALITKMDVVTIPRAEELFRIIERIVPDLILLDVLLNDKSGYEVLRQLKGNDKIHNIPVIFLTSKTAESEELEGLALGAVDYMFKPFSPQLLQARVSLHIKVAKQQKELKIYTSSLFELVDKKTSSLNRLQGAMMKVLSDIIEARDDTTGSHVVRTEKLLQLIIEEMLQQDIYRDIVGGWDINLFLTSSRLHDIGKIKIPDSILLKPGRLTEEEFEIMKQHVQLGENIIDGIQKDCGEELLLTYAKSIIGSHHEKWDGSGYPLGLSGNSIPLEGRLMAIADVYDALVSKRPYKEAFSHEKAMNIIMKSKGNHFDPILSEVFYRVANRIRG